VRTRKQLVHVTRTLAASMPAFVLTASTARAIDGICADNLRFALSGAGAFSGNLGLDTRYSASARSHLRSAGKLFAQGSDLALAAKYVPAFGRAKKAFGQLSAATSADDTVLSQLFTTRPNVLDAAGNLVRCALDDVIEHPAEAAKGEALYLSGLSVAQAQDFNRALGLFRKALKKIARFL
jgi:tetratricopeptide (TPR) repeat protein